MNYYSILGVTPDAEDIVITAAYRALAQRYHPDKWEGDPSEAVQRMISINEAYSVLRDPVKRNEYNRTQENASNFFESENSKDTNAAFIAALKEVEDRWGIACGIFPDLVAFRKNLQKISTQLAFSYVMFLLESKLFNKRDAIYKNMETKFLERYFGSNVETINFAKELIHSGRRDDARELNKLIDVMGENINPALLINKINGKQKNDSHNLLKNFKFNPSLYNASVFLQSIGFKIETKETGILSQKTQIRLTSSSGEKIVFEDTPHLVEYIKENY